MFNGNLPWPLQKVSTVNNNFKGKEVNLLTNALLIKRQLPSIPFVYIAYIGIAEETDFN